MAAPAQRQRQRRRNPGMIAFRLLWSMSYDRPVRLVMRDGSRRTATAVAMWTDERPPAKLGRQDSTVGFVLAGGAEIRVDAIEHVQLPIGNAVAAFEDD